MDAEAMTYALIGALCEAAWDKPEPVVAIGEAFGRGWRRASPPAGLVGRRCRWSNGHTMLTGTIRYVGGDGALLVEMADGVLVAPIAHWVTLLPWMADEQSDEVTP